MDDSLERIPFAHPSIEVRGDCVGGLGIVATGTIKAGELIERALLHRLLESYPGHEDPHVFVWWKRNGLLPRLQDDPNADNFGEVMFTEDDFKQSRLCWCHAGGNMTLYNTGPKEAWNTRSVKDFRNDVLALYATKDILPGQEIIIMYSSINWRACWDELRALVPPNNYN